jgi:hypothetical protein
MQSAPVHIQHGLTALNGHGRTLSSIIDLTIAEAPLHQDHEGPPKVVVRLESAKKRWSTAILTVYAGHEGPEDLTAETHNLASEDAGARWTIGVAGPFLNFADPAIVGTYGDWNVTDAFLVRDNAWAGSTPGGSQNHAAN